MNQTAAIDPATTEDWLLNGQVRFHQPATGYRVAIDPILLAAAVPAIAGEVALELGSGTGAASLCLHHRVRDCRIIGLENDADMLELACDNARLNDVGDRVAFVYGDVASPPAEIAAHSFDHVFSNPPYLQPARADGRTDSHVQRDAANIENSVGLSGWIEAMVAAVKPKGRLTMIHRADRLDELLSELRRHAGGIVVFPLWPKTGRPAKRVLISARFGVASPLRIAPGLVLHEDSGAYTGATRAVLENAAPLVI
ncbi:MAG: methyltransferase domain-containing protein [Alphaproteobacteria bacterium]|nr:methyltransferase domain-containing protein [Alphaproteobacteria bacterium]